MMDWLGWIIVGALIAFPVFVVFRLAPGRHETDNDIRESTYRSYTSNANEVSTVTTSVDLPSTTEEER